MPFKPQIKVQVFKCKTCKKPYNNPISHVCKIKLGQPRKRTNTKKKK